MLSHSISYSNHGKFHLLRDPLKRELQLDLTPLLFLFRLEAWLLELFLVQSQDTSTPRLVCCMLFQEHLGLLLQVGIKEELSLCLFVMFPSLLFFFRHLSFDVDDLLYSFLS